MRIYDAIKNFNTQFSYDPEIMHPEKFSPRDKFVIAGVGGSNLVADLVKIRDPYIDVIVHRNYGLPAMPRAEHKERLFIVDSYSGNTEETLDSFEEALKEGVPTATIATGGALLLRAQSRGVPYIQLPDAGIHPVKSRARAEGASPKDRGAATSNGIQPRSALGFQIKAVAKLMAREDLLRELSELVVSLKPELFEPQGRTLAEKLKGSVPVVYTSWENKGIAYNWKIKFNETGKIPAFFNVLPEANHNEMTGFDIQARTDADSKQARISAEERKKLNGPFHFIFLKDAADHPRIQKRMKILEQLYRDRGLPVEIVDLSGTNIWLKIFSSLALADWTAYYTAEYYGLESEHVPMVEEFKDLLK